VIEGTADAGLRGASRFSSPPELEALLAIGVGVAAGMC
jgi:hypothetical protein